MRARIMMVFLVIIINLVPMIFPITTPAQEPAKSALEPVKAKVGRPVRDVILALARRQMRELADGEYKKGTWEEFKAAKKPTGIDWVYPWGVTLYGMLRTSEVTGDKQLKDFVVR